MLDTLMRFYMGTTNTRGKSWRAVMNMMLRALNSQFSVLDYKFCLASGLPLFFSPMVEKS